MEEDISFSCEALEIHLVFAIEEAFYLFWFK